MGPASLRYQAGRLLHAAKRRRWSGRIERIYREIVAGWDQAAFVERFRPFWNPFPCLASAKFLDLDVWFREAIFRYLLMDLPSGRPVRVLDLGAGTGYFLVVCRQMGHEVLGLDVEGDPLYDACFDYFDLPRLVHRIEPDRPLPETGSPFDLVTAFMTGFNQDANEIPWGPRPWRFLLDEVRSRLNGGGRFVVKFNLNRPTGRFYSAEVERVMQRHRGFRARFSKDYVFLTAR